MSLRAALLPTPFEPGSGAIARGPSGRCAVRVESPGRRRRVGPPARPAAYVVAFLILLSVAARPGSAALRQGDPDTVPVTLRKGAPDTIPGARPPADTTPGAARRPAPPVQLDELVVTAARRPQRLKDVVVPTTVITRQAIEASGATDVGSVLVTRTGIQIDGGVPAGAGVRLQGLGAQRVLILLDGEPITGRINGNFDLSRLPAAIVERIEVVEGPQSVLYGSDALGGVVNIITRAPARRRLAGGIDLVYGSRSRFDLTGDARGTLDTLGYTATAGYRGVDLAPGVAATTATRAERWDGHASIDWRASPELVVNGGALFITERQRYRIGQLYNFSDNDQWALRLGAGWHRDGHRLTPSLSFSRFYHLSRAGTTPVPVAGTGHEDSQELLKASLVYGGPLLGGIIDAGIEHRRDAIRADRVADRTRVLHTTEPFFQLSWTIGDLSLTPGARLTWSEEWGRTLTPRLAFLYRPATLPSLALRASAGRGFRAPDFKELYLDFVNATAGYAVVGNPGLRPETSTNLTLGAEWAERRYYARIDVFHNEFRDFIETGEADASGTFTYENLASGSTSGVKVDLGYDWNRARVEGGYAFLRSREDQTGGPLLGNPRHSWRLALAARPVDRITVNATTQYTGATPTQRLNDGTVRERDPFLRVDLRLSTRLPWSLELGLGADNLLDENPGPEWPGYAGRRLYGAISWRPRGDAPGVR